MVEGANQLINSDNKVDRLQLAFIVGSAAIGFMCFAALPLLSAWALMTLTVILGLSLDKWLDNEKIPAPEAIVPDQAIKVFLATTIICLGVYFSFISVLPQILMGVIGSIALGGFFITQCVIGPQRKLNNALRQAITEHNIDNVRTLLNKGADPFELDPQNNHCFHHAISNHENSEAILNALCQHSRREKINFKSVVSQFRLFQDAKLLTHCRAWYEALKPLFNSRTQENRDHFYTATETLLNALSVPFQAILNNAFAYIQQQIEYERTIQHPNLAGNTPEEMIDIIFNEDLNNPVRNALKNAFSPTENNTETPVLEPMSASTDEGGVTPPPVNVLAPTENNTETPVLDPMSASTDEGGVTPPPATPEQPCSTPRL